MPITVNRGKCGGGGVFFRKKEKVIASFGWYRKNLFVVIRKK